MKIIDPILRWVFVLVMPLFLLAAAFRIPASSAFFYEYFFDKYQVGTTTGLDEVGLHQAANGLVNYFSSNQEYINVTVTKNGQPFTLFNEREVVHLKDVKSLFQFDLRVLLATGAFALLYAVYSILRGSAARRTLAKSALIGGGLTLGLMAGDGYRHAVRLRYPVAAVPSVELCQRFLAT